MILSSLLVLTTATTAALDPALSAPPLSSASTSTFQENLEPIFHSLFDPTLYLGAGIFFGSVSLLSAAGWGACQLTPWASTTGNQCLISSQIFGISSMHSFAQVLRTSALFAPFFKEIPSTHSAWDQNQKLLSQIPVSSSEDKELLNFLEKHWLAKVTGCYPFLVDWLCPTFGISFQVHPESTNSYARDPANKYSDTYINRVEAWKQCLPHPKEFPLILTRPFNIRDRLPLCFEIPHGESLESAMERLSNKMCTTNLPVVVDLTAVLPSDAFDRKGWLAMWQSFEPHLSQLCRENRLDLDQVLFIQRVQQRSVGGIRVLPLLSTSEETLKKQYDFLLEWISRFGLTANRVELDRPLFTSERSQNFASPILTTFASKEEWIEFLNSKEQDWKSSHPQKSFLFKATMQVLKALGTALPQEKWEEAMQSPTRSALVQLAFKKIQDQLGHLFIEEEKLSFHETTTRIEQIHADFTSLLEIFMPFVPADFPEIYKEHLTTIPKALQPLTHYAIHSSGMTSLGAIFQAVEKSVDGRPRILYGENTYFEIINLAERVSKTTPIKNATEQDWKEADLILVQFSPTVKRINSKVTEYQATEYHVERIEEILRLGLKSREGKPLTVALDATLDYSDSERVGNLLTQFQEEIEKGTLNILCYRSGIKFDLFGMDNYCGAPFFSVNNRDQKWAVFDSLLSDPALQTDRLSLNWFCLVYKYAAPYLEGYRKQIFDNTRAVLNKIPKSLFNQENACFRVIPIDADINPTFIDIKIFGPWHAFRGEFLVGVHLTIKCMQAGYPLLFRPGIGFFHPNLAVLFGKECSTVRLTVGLDPAQVDVIVGCLERLNACNGH